MKKIGVFLEGELVAEYPFNYTGGQEALSDAKKFSSDEGFIHEVKIFEED